jgi:RNA polymerase sigma factor (sigma-70 family)
LKSDAELVAHVLAGGRARFTELVRRHERAVRAVAFAIVGDHEAASDVAQETFLQAFQKLGTLHAGAAFGGWVRSIARNQALTVVRRRMKTVGLDCVDRVASAAPAGPDADLVRRLVEAVARLPEHEQAVVMLYYFDNHDVQGVGAILGRSAGTVTMQLCRARERLRNWLKEQDS